MMWALGEPAVEVHEAVVLEDSCASAQVSIGSLGHKCGLRGIGLFESGTQGKSG